MADPILIKSPMTREEILIKHALLRYAFEDGEYLEIKGCARGFLAVVRHGIYYVLNRTIKSIYETRGTLAIVKNDDCSIEIAEKKDSIIVIRNKHSKEIFKVVGDLQVQIDKVLYAYISDNYISILWEGTKEDMLTTFKVEANSVKCCSVMALGDLKDKCTVKGRYLVFIEGKHVLFRDLVTGINVPFDRIKYNAESEEIVIE